MRLLYVGKDTSGKHITINLDQVTDIAFYEAVVTSMDPSAAPQPAITLTFAAPDRDSCRQVSLRGELAAALWTWVQSQVEITSLALTQDESSDDEELPQISPF